MQESDIVVVWIASSDVLFRATTHHPIDDKTKTMVKLGRDISPVQKESHGTKAIKLRSRGESEPCLHQTRADQAALTKVQSSGASGSICLRNVTATSDACQVIAGACGHAMVFDNVRASRGATQIIGIVSGTTFDQIMRRHRSTTRSSQSNHLEDAVKALSLRGRRIDRSEIDDEDVDGRQTSTSTVIKSM